MLISLLHAIFMKIGENDSTCEVQNSIFLFILFWWSTLTNYWKHFSQSICREFISPVGYFYIIVLFCSVGALFQPKWQKVTFGKHTLKNYGSHMLNLLPNKIKSCTKINKFKSLLKSWEGPKYQCTMCNALS